MKTLILIRSKRLLTAGLIASAVVLSTTARAGLLVPYKPDADTLHLWHFDDSTINQGTDNFVTVTDAVATASITLTNFGLGTNSVNTGAAVAGTPPYTNIFLQPFSATANLKGSLNIIPGGGAAGKAYAFTGTSNNIGGYFTDTTPFRNPTSGAFTFEALLYIQGPVFSGSIGTEWEIFCGDSQGESGGRSWQFRMQPGATPSLNVNFITQSGGTTTPNFSPLLPATGPNALTVSNWYHVALTFTGNTPTNGDTAGVLNFYWTLFDPFRTNADLLASFTNATFGTLGGGPIPAIGGSARRNNGVGNAGAFEGLIDEVRISDIARLSSDMAFTNSSDAIPPIITNQPPANTLVGYGSPLLLPTLVIGSLPLTSQWQATNSTASGWTNVPGQTDSTLQINPVKFPNAGVYRLIVTNAYGSATSHVANVTVGANFSELFNTGVDSNGVVDTVNLPQNPDLHYQLISSSDVNHLGPAATVWNMFAYPIAANGGFFANPDGISQWVGPQGNPGGTPYNSPQGNYTYRITFVLDSVSLASPVTLSGTWWVGNSGSDILLNGASKGIAGLLNQQNTGSGFVITNGFLPGLNTLDFVLPLTGSAGTYQESALRVAISGIGQALAPGIPVINTEPANVTVRENGHATFAVVALGRPPLTYQWYADGTLITDATNRTLALNPVFTGGQGTNFIVVIKNDSGSVTSAPAAVLTLTTNRPPVPPPTFHLTIYSNQVANVSIASIIYGSTDADNDPITLLSFDSSSTNFGTVVQNGIDLSYTPPPDYTGPDQYSYTIFDTVDTAVGLVQINVIPLLTPTISTAGKSGGNIVFSGSGGAAGGGYTVLTATNLLTALTNWTVLTTGTFDTGGGFSITNAISAGPAQRYYLLQVP
jgi:hypothetical protein